METCVFHEIQREINEDHEGRLRTVEGDITEIKIDLASSKEGIFQRLDRVCETLNRVVTVLGWASAFVLTTGVTILGTFLYDKLF